MSGLRERCAYIAYSKKKEGFYQKFTVDETALTASFSQRRQFLSELRSIVNPYQCKVITIFFMKTALDYEKLFVFLAAQKRLIRYHALNSSKP